MNKNAELILNDYFERYHRPEYIHPDPLIFPLRYVDMHDVEAAAFISAVFALGRVSLILQFLESVFEVLGNPYEGLVSRTETEIETLFTDFKYRFYSSADIIHFMKGLRSLYLEYGSIEACFMKGFNTGLRSGSSVLPIVTGLASVAAAVNRGGSQRNVVSNPSSGCASKRLFLFLRWVVRSDEIDPGGWSLERSALVIPLDTHIMQVGRYLGLTERKGADLKTAVEITEKLKLFDKADPVKYDFSMSRIGIHPDLSYAELEKSISGLEK